MDTIRQQRRQFGYAILGVMLAGLTAFGKGPPEPRSMRSVWGPAQSGKPHNAFTDLVRFQDAWFLEKLAHFDREVIPERRMHAKGSGSYGTFTVTHDITQYTKANIFSQVGKNGPLFIITMITDGKWWLTFEVAAQNQMAHQMTLQAEIHMASPLATVRQTSATQ